MAAVTITATAAALPSTILTAATTSSTGGCPSCRKRQQAEEEGAAARVSALAAMAAAGPASDWPPSLAMADGVGRTQGPAPERLHDLKHDSSVLALAVSDAYIFAGTHDGEILVWSLGSFQQVARIQAHKRSVLCLFLSPSSSTPGSSVSRPVPSSPSTSSASSSPPDALLVSSGGDSSISVWSPTTFQRLYEIYSSYDVAGDIFSVAYSAQQQTVYFGAQDTSIQWIRLDDPRRRVAPDSAHHPDKRLHRFFDSKNVGGTSTPRRNDDRWALIPKAQTVLEAHPDAIRQFAHYGYVYCMLMARGPAHDLDADEEVLISGGGDGTVKVWKLGRGETRGRRRRSAGDGSDNDDDEDSSADGADNADDADDAADDDGAGTIREVMVLGNDDAVSVLSLAIDGSFLYCGKLDGVVELWDLDTRQRLRVIQAHDRDVMSLQMCWGMLWSASASGYAAKHSTVHYDGSSSTTTNGTGSGNGSTPTSTAGETVSQKYQCLSRWKAHDGKILASAVAALHSARLYITGANDAMVSVWRVPDECGAARGAAEASEDVMLATLRDFVAYKTISSRPEFAEDCHRGATFLCTLFKRLGGEVWMLQTPDKAHNPVVLAKFAGKRAKGKAAAAAAAAAAASASEEEQEQEQAKKQRKRILFYGHYDVVAADTRKGKWAADPFAMKGMNGHLYGRGVSDNKGPIMAALFAVADLLHDKALESDVVFLIEGEEESGSRGFQETVRAHQALIGPVDYILLANSYWLDDTTPCLTYGLRGVLHATVCVDAARPDLHSGVDGSYLVSEPLTDLTLVLARLKAPPHNRVMLPGFYDGVLPMQPDEEARLDAVVRRLAAAAEKTPDAVASASSSAAAIKAGLLARWREPNLTIHRYKVSGPDGSLVSAHACANISLRLVPGQEVDAVVASLEAFLHDEFGRLGSSNTLSVHVDNKAEPWLGDPDNYIFQTLERALVQVWGMVGEGDDNEDDALRQAPRRPLYIREGGSIPAIRFLEKQFGAPAAHLPCGQASDAAHLDNERLRVVNLLKSREIFKRVFQEL